ncbi:imm11 family protein [Leisingera sp. M658]|uniref:imm11 family protein n=1 Tax=Leisingera sp. M658 TaxID=2867015 RepID=UPI0021A340B6|nr:DUF1629 domain-containing protein [Leisingera sp. M658]UWQ76342.1 hypothetical protein K3724_07885 [Leisingera sp. M658]
MAHGDKRSVTFEFSPRAGEAPSPWPEGKWTSRIRHIEAGSFDEEARRNFASYWTLINPDVLELPDVLGEFKRMDRSFSAFHRELREAIVAADPELCSFVSVSQVYDLRHERVINEPEYFFSAVKQTKDSLDVENSETKTISFHDGSTIPGFMPKSRVHRSALKGAMLWRDQKSREVLCTSEFKALAEAAGCVGMAFYQVGISEA